MVSVYDCQVTASQVRQKVQRINSVGLCKGTQTMGISRFSFKDRHLIHRSHPLMFL